MLDEAKEMGEKIAEKVEEMRPKTKEERKEEMVEEALGVEENKGMLEKITEEFSEIIEETKEQLKEIEEGWVNATDRKDTRKDVHSTTDGLLSFSTFLFSKYQRLVK